MLDFLSCMDRYCHMPCACLEYGMAGIENQIKRRQNLELIQTGQTSKIDKNQQNQHNPLCMMGNFAGLIFQN